MTEENLISLVMATVRNNMPSNAKVFNFSIDFLCDAPDTVTAEAKILHKGHKTMVLDVEVQAMQGSLVAKALTTVLL